MEDHRPPHHAQGPPEGEPGVRNVHLSGAVGTYQDVAQVANVADGGGAGGVGVLKRD